MTLSRSEHIIRVLSPVILVANRFVVSRFINATTVGYGDFRPAHGRSKFLAIALHAANYAFGVVYEVSNFRDR